MAGVEGRPAQHAITLNGIDVKTYTVKLTCYDPQDNEPGSATLVLVRQAENVLGTCTAETMIGKTLTYERGISASTEDKRFNGEIVNFKSDGRLMSFECRDKLWRARKKVETAIYVATDDFAGNIKSIFTDLMERAGVPVTEAYIQDPGVDYTINKFVLDTEKVIERARKLIKALPNWNFYYDTQLDTVRLEQTKYEAAGVTLTVGGNVVNTPQWDNEGADLVQTVTVRGGVAEALKDQLFTGDGSTTQFSLTYEPVTVKVEHPVGTEKTQGVLNVTPTANYHYYVDKVNKKIVFLTAPTTSGGANNIKVTYTYLLERPVTVTSPSSIASYARATDGSEYPYEEVVHSIEALDIDDTHLYADAILSAEDTINPSTTLQVKNVIGLHRNMSVPVVDANTGVTTTAYIEGVETHYPYDFDVVKINRRPQGEAAAVDTLFSRTKRLEETITRGYKLLFIVFPKGRRVGVARHIFKKRSRQYTVADAEFILDHAIHGVLDTGVLGTDSDSAYDAWVLDWQMPSHDVFREYVLENTYMNTGSTTATIDTSAQTITASGAARVFVTDIIAKGPSFTQVKITLNFDTAAINSVDIADNSSFTSAQNFTGFVTGAQLTCNLTTALTSLYFRFNMASGAVIKTAKNGYGTPTAPAVKIELSSYT